MPASRSQRAAELRCDTCGQLPEVPRFRMALANVATVFPIELLAHVIVLNTGLPDPVKVLILAVTATALVIWVAEPSVRRLLRTWLHAATVRHRRTLHDSPALWRVGVAIPDEPGSLKRVARSFERLGVNILRVHVRRMPDGARDDFLVTAPDSVTDTDLADALYASGGRDVRVARTTPVMVTDGQTQALSLATQVVSDPSTLADVVADLLAADVIDVPHSNPHDYAGDPTILRLPNLSRGPLVFSRPNAPFTSAESARAHRLAELAEIIELTQLGAAPNPGR